MGKENKIKHYDIKTKVVYAGNDEYKPAYYRFIVRSHSMQEARNHVIEGIKIGLGGDEEAKKYKISIKKCSCIKIDGIVNTITEEE
ncbi:hypothetical protein [Ornithobacterium rhinotracheale]